MALKKHSFVSYKTEEERAKQKGKVFTIRLNAEEIKRLEQDAYILEQEKPGTTLKILAEIGHQVLHDRKTGAIIQTVFKNKRNNRRLGVEFVEPKF